MNSASYLTIGRPYLTFVGSLFEIWDFEFGVYVAPCSNVLMAGPMIRFALSILI